MKHLAVVALLLTTTACIDDSPQVTGSVSLLGGQTACTDEDGDRAWAEVRIEDAAGNLVLAQDLGCPAAFSIGLDPGTYVFAFSSLSADPIVGLGWIEDVEEREVVVDETGASLGRISLSVD